MKPTTSLSLLALLVWSCNGRIGDTLPLLESPPEAVDPNEAPSFAGPLAPGPQTLLATPRLVRLTHEQWENTIRDLFRLETRVNESSHFATDEAYGTYDNNYHRLVVGSSLWSDYQRAAEALAERFSTPASMATWLPAGMPASGGARRDAYLDRFGARVFRRALTDAERYAYQMLFEKGTSLFASGDAFRDGVRLTLEAMLQSVSFLYRREVGREAEGDGIRLRGDEVASRLSYLLLGSMPDDALLAAAADGSLDNEPGILRELDRLLADPRVKRSLARLHDQRFGLQEYTDLAKDSTKFPGWSSERHGAAYLAEARAFLEGLVLNGGSLRDFMLSQDGYVNADLASIYGVPGAFDDTHFVKTALSGRPGFLTRAGFLAAKANLTDPATIHRGLFVNTSLLCRSLSPPPDINRQLELAGTTNRQRIDSITGKGTCGEGCHGTTINPPGYALESFDAIGRARTFDNGERVDTSGEYAFVDGASVQFDGIEGLVAAIADEPAYHRCMTAYLVEYFYGREVLNGDMPLVDSLAMRSLDEDAPLSALLAGIVTSRGFRYRTPNESEVSQ